MAEVSESPEMGVLSEAEESPVALALPKAGRKDRVRKPEKPDKAALDVEILEILKQIDEKSARIKEIKDILDSKQQNRQTVNEEIVQARNKLTDIIAQFKIAVEQKKVLREQLAVADEARRRMREDAKSLRDKLSFVKVEQIDEELQKLDYKMAHSTLSLNEEKKIVQQIRDLTKSRDFVKDYNDRLDRINADESSRVEALQKIKEKDDQLNKLKSLEMEQKVLIDNIRSKERVQSQDFPSLIEEKQAAYDEIKELRDEVRQKRIDFKAKEDEFWAQERAWRAQQAEDRKKAYEEREKRRQEISERRKAFEAENFVEPYTDEIIICDQLLPYLQKFCGSEDGASAAQDGEETKTVIEAPKDFGELLVSKKNRGDEELDSWFGGMKGKKGKKKGASKAKVEKISLSLDSISSFARVKVAPPSTLPEVISAIEQLKEKKAEFQKLQVADREKRIAAENVAGLENELESNGHAEVHEGSTEDKINEGASGGEGATQAIQDEESTGAAEANNGEEMHNNEK